MTIRIFNSMTRRVEPMVPRQPGKVGIYVCGMTVYDYCHLGHARALIVFDMVVRYLRERGYQVDYVRNITDIDDKIINRARENGESVDALTERFIRAMHEDEAVLGVLRPDQEPRATEYVDQIIAMVERLVDNGYAYQGANRDVYFSVRKFPAYGRLSGQSVDRLRSGARIQPDESKQDPLDFVVWKAAKPGEPKWESPWGTGRPGWHIECSAMSSCCLGQHFDIHGGGVDLKFPHHESEIAQSEAATGQPFVQLWMHNGHVQIDDEKMSKSLGNFFTIREILALDQRERMGEVIRYLVLSSHYRGPLAYSRDALENARAGLTRLYLALDKWQGHGGTADGGELADYTERFHVAMDEDFNTPEGLAVLFEMVRELNRLLDRGDPKAGPLGAGIKRLGNVLGLLGQPPHQFLTATGPGGSGHSRVDDARIEALVAERNAARGAGQFQRADQIRDELTAMGVLLEDLPDGGSKWRVK